MQTVEKDDIPHSLSPFYKLLLVHFSQPYRWGSVVKGHDARRRVCQHSEVGCGRGAHGQWATVSVDLVIHQTPLLQERMNPADRHLHFIHLYFLLYSAFFLFQLINKNVIFVVCSRIQQLDRPTSSRHHISLIVCGVSTAEGSQSVSYHSNY